MRSSYYDPQEDAYNPRESHVSFHNPHHSSIAEHAVEPLHIRIPRSPSRHSTHQPLPYPTDPDAFMRDYDPLEKDLYVAPLKTNRCQSPRSTVSSSKQLGTPQHFDPKTRRVSTVEMSAEAPPIFRPYRDEAPSTCGSPGYDPSLVLPSNEGIAEAARGLRAAMRGLGSDERALINILATKNPIQIDEIRQAYLIEYNRNLLDDIKGDTSRKFGDVILNLANGPLLRDVYRLKHAFSHKDESILLEVLINRFNPDIEAIQSRFREVFLHETVLYYVERMDSLTSTGRELVKIILEARKSDEDETVDEE
ncbi:hypothetical protein KEM55_006079, partial [Ascosphaera atra]